MKSNLLLLIRFFTGAILILFFTVFMIAGCSNDDNPVVPPQENISKITGTITNYPGGSSIVRAVLWKTAADSFFVGTDTVENNGSLNMSLTTPPSNFLVSAKQLSRPSVVVSDSTASFTGFSILSVYNFSNVQIANLTKKNFADTVAQGSFLIQYIFATKPFTITGADTSTFGSDTNIVKYNLSFKEGWNLVTAKAVIVRANLEMDEYTVGELSGATWRYEAFSLPKMRPNTFLEQRRLRIF